MIEAATDFKESFIARVKALRDNLGWSQDKMATALGIPLENYKKYETRTPLPHHIIERFAVIVGKDVEYVLTGKSMRSISAIRRNTKAAESDQKSVLISEDRPEFTISSETSVIKTGIPIETISTGHRKLDDTIASLFDTWIKATNLLRDKDFSDASRALALLQDLTGLAKEISGRLADQKIGLPKLPINNDRDVSSA